MNSLDFGVQRSSETGMMVQKKDKYGLYDSTTEKQSEVKYEMVKVPLQDYVSTARKATCKLWTDTKTQWNKIKGSVTSSVSKARRKTQDRLQSIGINNPNLAMEVGAVGSAGLLGLLLARKRSLFHRLLYPTLAGGSVWAIIYFSSVENRAVLLKNARKIKVGYQKNVSNYEEKNTTKKDSATVSSGENKDSGTDSKS